MFNQDITIHIRKKSDPHDIETIEIYIETLKDLENIINRLVKTSSDIEHINLTWIIPGSKFFPREREREEGSEIIVVILLALC